jgi:hypothetical protein
MGTIFKTKEVSMKWFKRLIYRWYQDGQDMYNEEPATLSSKPLRNRLATIRSNDIDSEEGLNITVRKAIGGKIVTFRHYDHKTDRTNHKLYVVPDDLDFDKELGKMITLESMRM